MNKCKHYKEASTHQQNNKRKKNVNLVQQKVRKLRMNNKGEQILFKQEQTTDLFLMVNLKGETYT